MRYADPRDFDRAIADRLRRLSSESGIDQSQLRTFVAFDRVLARLAAVDDRSFVVKGGVALEYRLGHRARPTLELDVAMHGFPEARSILRAVTQVAMEDHFSVEIKIEPRLENPIVEGTPTYRWKLALSLGDMSVLKKRLFALPILLTLLTCSALPELTQQQFA